MRKIGVYDESIFDFKGNIFGFDEYEITTKKFLFRHMWQKVEKTETDTIFRWKGSSGKNYIGMIIFDDIKNLKKNQMSGPPIPINEYKYKAMKRTQLIDKMLCQI